MPDSGGLRGNSFWPITDTSAEPMFIKTIESFPDSFLGPWLRFGTRLVEMLQPTCIELVSFRSRPTIPT